MAEIRISDEHDCTNCGQCPVCGTDNAWLRRAAVQLAKMLPKGRGERVLTHYDPEVMDFLKAVENIG